MIVDLLTSNLELWDLLHSKPPLFLVIMLLSLVVVSVRLSPIVMSAMSLT